MLSQIREQTPVVQNTQDRKGPYESLNQAHGNHRQAQHSIPVSKRARFILERGWFLAPPSSSGAPVVIQGLKVLRPSDSQLQTIHSDPRCSDGWKPTSNFQSRFIQDQLIPVLPGTKIAFSLKNLLSSSGVDSVMYLYTATPPLPFALVEQAFSHDDRVSRPVIILTGERMNYSVSLMLRVFDFSTSLSLSSLQTCIPAGVSPASYTMALIPHCLYWRHLALYILRLHLPALPGCLARTA